MIRPASEADLPALVALEASLFGPDAWSPGLLLAALPDLVVDVADPGVGAAAEVAVAGQWSGHGRSEASGAAETQHWLGYAALRVGAKGAPADLDRVAVHPDVRRGGVGSALLDEVLARAADAGADRVLLEVSDQNAAALAFYATHGFAEIGRRRHYYRDGSDALVLERVVGPR